MRYKTQGVAKLFIFDKARIASLLKNFKKDLVLYPSCQFVFERIRNIDVVEKFEAIFF